MARLVGTTRGFLKSVDKWTKETKQRSEDVLREASKDLYDAMMAATPVDTGNLKNSLRASKQGQPSAQFPSGPGYDNSSVAQAYQVMDSLKVGERISMYYAATYAARVHYGFHGADSLGRVYNQQGRFWVPPVASRWREFVRAAARRLRG